MDRNLFAARLWLLLQAGRKDPKAGLTHAQYLVGLAFLRGANRKGCLWPGEAYLAKASACCIKTVQRAKKRLEELGALVWQQRRVAWNRMGTCIYNLRVPPKPKDKMSVKSNVVDSLKSEGGAAVVDNSAGKLSPMVAGALSRFGKRFGYTDEEVAERLGPIATG